MNVTDFAHRDAAESLRRDLFAQHGSDGVVVQVVAVPR
jgi:hypothetical protein